MTFYQKVKRALSATHPVTYARLADVLGADAEATRQALIELKRRGKAMTDTGATMRPEAQLWLPKE